MAIPLAVTTAAVIIETAVKVAAAIYKMVGSSENSEQIAALSQQIDQLTADLLNLRKEMRELGQTILLAISNARLLNELFELNRIQSRAESALNHLQAFRTTNLQLHHDIAISESEAAVTEFTNATVFADRAQAIGGFLFVVNARLQVVTELESVLLSSVGFRRQINKWVGIVRNVANEFEGEIRAQNKNLLSSRTSTVDEEKKCAFDIESRRVICEVVREGHKRVTIFYSNISGTIDYAFNSDVPGSGQPFGNVSDAINRGVLDDLQNLGVNNMRQLANIWGSTGRISHRVLIWKDIMKRSLTELELRVMTEALEKGELDAERIVRGLLHTREFLHQAGILSGDASTQGTVKTVFTRVLGREPEPDELRINSEMHDQFGYGAFVAALSTLVSLSEEEGQGCGYKRVTVEVPTLNTLDVLRSL